MSNTILLKRSAAANAIPESGNLTLGELAINTTDTRLFTKNGAGDVIDITSIQITGDITANGKTGANTTATLANTAVVPGTYGGSSNGTTNVGVFTVDSKGRLTSASNVSISTSGLSNGTSNISIANNGNVSVSVAGTSNVAVFTVTGVDITGNITTGGILTDNYYYANGSPLDFQQPAGSNTQIQFNSDGDFGASSNFTFDSDTNILTVTGNVSAGNVSAAGNITADTFLGNISGATGEFTGNITADTFLGNISGDTGTFTGNVGADTFLGNVDGGTITATGNITGGNLSGTNITGTLTTASQPNITALGNLNALTVTGNVTAGNLFVDGIESVGTFVVNNDATIIGNLTVQGSTITANVTSLVISDPIINLGRGANNTPLISNDGLDRGVEMFYFMTSEQIAFMGYDNNAGRMIMASNVSVSNNIVTVNSYGITEVGTLEAAVANVTGNIAAGNVSATNIAGTLTTAAQPNITSLGNLTVANIDTAVISVLANITSTTISTSNVTGALTVAGGVGVTGNVYADNLYKGGVTVLSANDTIDGGTY